MTNNHIILSPMNPWLQGSNVHDRLLKHWENREFQGDQTGKSSRPFPTLSIKDKLEAPAITLFSLNSRNYLIHFRTR
jgi:hypothetical protein